MAAQLTLYRVRPTNYGLITGVLNHLLRSVETTPKMVPAHVIRSLADLRLRQTRSRFGMMFLHNINLTSVQYALVDIEDDDTQDVLAALKIKKKFNPRRNPSHSGPSVAYPLGQYPTWKAVQQAVRHEPWNIIRQYQVPPLSRLLIVRRSFQMFTEQMWDSLNDTHLTAVGRPEAHSLDVAMKAWSVGAVFDCITKVSWETINTGHWKSISGPRERAFHMRVRMYFPSTREIASDSPALRRFHLLDTGYLSQFWQSMAPLSDDERDDVYRDLEDLFRHIQCLPGTRIIERGDAPLPTTTWQISGGAVRVITNPSYYMIKGLGNDRPHRRGARSGKAVLSERDALQQQLQKANVPAAQHGMIIRNALGAQSNKDPRRSVRMNNARKPPIRRRVSSSSDGDEADEDSSSTSTI